MSNLRDDSDQRLREALAKQVEALNLAVGEVVDAYQVFLLKLRGLPAHLQTVAMNAIAERAVADVLKPITSTTGTELTVFDKVANFLRSKGNEPQTTKAIMFGTHVPRGTLSVVLHKSHADRFEKLPHPVHGHLKLWRLKEDEPQADHEESPDDDYYDGEPALKEAFKGKTAVECAELILSESGPAACRHVSDIAEWAFDHGYQGRPSPNSENGSRVKRLHRLSQSFLAAMSRSDKFDNKGGGNFALSASH